MGQAEIIQVQSPYKGVNRVVGREVQPPDTCWDALNVLPYDKFGRRRVAQRTGLSKQYATQLGSTRIQGMLAVPGANYSATFTSSGMVTTPVSTYTFVDSGVTQLTNNIQWPTNYVNNGSNAGVQVASTVTKGSTLQFNLIFTGTSTGSAFRNLYLSLNNGSTTWSNPSAGNDAIDVSWQYNPAGGANNIHVEVDINVGASFFSVSGNSTGTIPFGTLIPCSFTWDASGNASASFGALSTAGSVNQPGPNSTMQFWGDVPGTGSQVAASTINFTAGGSVVISTGQFGYSTTLLAVCNGFLWKGDSAGNITSTITGNTGVINPNHQVSMCYALGSTGAAYVFIADGTTVWLYNLATNTLAFASTNVVSGTIPQNVSFCCTWRGRIVLAGDSVNPQNLYMSRPSMTVSTTFFNPGSDWNYGSTDPAAAFAQNLGRSGQTGEPITALIPFSDDYLKVGCAHSLWMYQGDPADGGSFTNVSNQIGIIGKDAWCVDPAGTLWFMATGGLFSVRPAWEFYRPPEPVSLQSVNQNFTGLDPTLLYCSMVYDPDLHYLHMLVTPVTGQAGTHLTMDARSVGGDGPPGFWPQKFVSTAGPTCTILFNGDANPNNRVILFGGNDGFIRNWNTVTLDDDGTAISASVTMGPYHPVPGQAAVLQGVTIDMGELPLAYASTAWNVNVIMAAGPEAYSVTEALPNSQNPHPIPTISSLNLDRRQKTFRQRLRGEWFSITLQNLTDNEFFSFESATLEFAPSGRNRVRR